MATNDDQTQLALEILDKVNSFYELSFNHLLYLGAGIITIFGVIVPYGISYLQKRQIKIKQDELEKILVEKVNILLAEAKSSLEEQFKKELEETNNKMREAIFLMDGKAHQLQAAILESNKSFGECVKHSCYAINGYAQGNKERGAKRVIDLLLTRMGMLNKKLLDADSKITSDFDDCIKILEKKYGTDQYADEIMLLKGALAEAKKR